MKSQLNTESAVGSMATLLEANASYCIAAGEDVRDILEDVRIWLEQARAIVESVTFEVPRNACGMLSGAATLLSMAGTALESIGYVHIATSLTHRMQPAKSVRSAVAIVHSVIHEYDGDISIREQDSRDMLSGVGQLIATAQWMITATYGDAMHSYPWSP